MRLFIAAELPGPLLDALAETSADLRALVRGRYVATDSFHVTLAFLGNVENARVHNLANVVEDVCAGHAPFEACLGELGSFGRPEKATLWQGFADRHPFAELAQNMRAGLAHAGFSFDSKGFIPHVSLMRNADLCCGTLPMPHVARGTIEHVALFSSNLSGARPVYTALHRSTLQEHGKNGVAWPGEI